MHTSTPALIEPLDDLDPAVIDRYLHKWWVEATRLPLGPLGPAPDAHSPFPAFERFISAALSRVPGLWGPRARWAMTGRLKPLLGSGPPYGVDGLTAALPPCRHRGARVWLTHDVDYPWGLDLLAGVLELERLRGLTSAVFLLADGTGAISARLLDRLTAGGILIGIHGVGHDLLLGRRKPETIDATIALARERIPPARAFRAPALRATDRLIAAVARAELPIDSSISAAPRGRLSVSHPVTMGAAEGKARTDGEPPGALRRDGPRPSAGPVEGPAAGQGGWPAARLVAAPGGVPEEGPGAGRVAEPAGMPGEGPVIWPVTLRDDQLFRDRHLPVPIALSCALALLDHVAAAGGWFVLDTHPEVLALAPGFYPTLLDRILERHDAVVVPADPRRALRRCDGIDASPPNSWPRPGVQVRA